MSDKIPDFIKDATNVYRTKGYIVCQVIGIQYDSSQAYRRQAPAVHDVRKNIQRLSLQAPDLRGLFSLLFLLYVS